MLTSDTLALVTNLTGRSKGSLGFYCNNPTKIPKKPDVKLLIKDPCVRDFLELSITGSEANGELVDHNITIKERNGGRVFKIRKADRTVINTFSDAPYPKVDKLAPSHLVFNIETTGIYFGAKLITTCHDQLAKGLRTTVDHVTELQTLNAFMNSVLAKALPSGATGFNVRYDAEKIFGRDGYFDYTLKSLGIDRDFAGVNGNTKISSLLFKLLGSTEFQENLQLLTAEENSLKAVIWALKKNMNADRNWNKMSPTMKLDALWRLKTVVDYLNDQEVQQSLGATLDRMRAVL
ncbi:putative class v [Rosellinia necatrix]|uniref:Putative class v n=1 Tax=Rosellinia necatrix TaxID=77044 RepID=A0A1S8ACK7_ROSNE|nr:putative class v [Rosellinia necatrix]